MRSLYEQNHYEVLEVRGDAGAREIERAYLLARSTYEPGSVAFYSVFGEHDADAIRQRIETAYEVLSDPEARDEYDAALARGEDSGDPAERAVARAAAEPPAAASRAESLDDDDEHDFDGPRLRRARVRRAVELQHVADVTKINPNYLRCLEEERFGELPAPVYVRGFLTAYARCLGLEVDEVVPGYIERYEASVSASHRARLRGGR